MKHELFLLGIKIPNKFHETKNLNNIFRRFSKKIVHITDIVTPQASAILPCCHTASAHGITWPNRHQRKLTSKM